MFELKDYQNRALAALSEFLIAARGGSVEDAFLQAQRDQGIDKPVLYHDHGFGEMPYICLRLPTGGGKTVLASYSVSVVQKAYLEQDYPIVLWLVPTNTIREQTLDALKTVGHPYRQALENEFGLDRLRVFDVGEVIQIRRQDIGRKALVIVGTLAALRVEDTSGRKVYVHHEDFDVHFVGMTDPDRQLERISEKDLLEENGLRREDIGKIKYSFANLLALHKPLVIMDEAHNARTKLTFDTLKRLHPACIVEFTATPDTSATSASNILYRCSASELKAENMIKLPIVLTEHKDWQAAVRDAVLTGKKLNLAAQHESDFVRPIVLFQADAKNGDVPVEVLKAHLLEQLHVDEREVAIATGKQRELDGLNLFSPACLIKYIITIEALKEGWDCSFAYVFCSVKDVKSSKDAEQLLGRVLRMPHAKRRNHEALNCAYAHLASPDFSAVAKQLTDKLIDMGFEPLEAASGITQGNTAQNDLFDDAGPVERTEPSLRLELTTPPELTPDTSTNVVITPTANNTFSVEIKGEVSPETKNQLLQGVTGKEKQHLSVQIEQHNLRIVANRAPSLNGKTFAPLPQLFVKQGDLWNLLDSDKFLDWRKEWSLLDFPAELPSFKLEQTADTFEVDLNGKKLIYRHIDQNSAYNNDWVDGGFTENDLLFWLEREVRQIGLIPAQLRAFLGRLISYLTQRRGLPLTGLIRCKYILARAVRELIEDYRQQAAKQGFNYALLEDDDLMETRFDPVYDFSPGYYPARPPFYEGRYLFSKHFYPEIESFKKDDGEEFECAKIIDSHPKVRYWIRNLVDRGSASFCLPLAKGRFYPDFIVELMDGRRMVIEYKGQHLILESGDKERIGELWARKSGGRCLFLMAVKKDVQGRTVFQQIDELIHS
jgi:type III restriction enzyme